MEKWGLQKYKKSRVGKNKCGHIKVAQAMKHRDSCVRDTPTRPSAHSIPTPPSSRQSTPTECPSTLESVDISSYIPEVAFIDEGPVNVGSASGTPTRIETTALLDVAKIMETKSVADFFLACRLYDDAFNFYATLHKLMSTHRAVDGYENIVIATAVGCSHCAMSRPQTDKALAVLDDIICRENMQSTFPLMILLCWSLRVDLLAKRGDIEAAKAERKLILDSAHSRSWFWDNLGVNDVEMLDNLSMFPIQLHILQSISAGAFITPCDLTTVLPRGATSIDFLPLQDDSRSTSSVLVRKNSSSLGAYIHFDARFIHQVQHLALFSHLWVAWYSKTLNGGQ